MLVDDHVEMTDLDLTKGNYHHKDFRAAQMPGVDFTDAKVDGANFSCKARLFVSEHWFPSFSTCWVTNLEGARFATASVTGVKFDYANLKDAVIGGSTPGFTTVNDSTFVHTQMPGITIREARISNDTFNNADMQDSKWLGGRLLNKNLFIGADLKVLAGTVSISMMPSK